jgi:transcriptional regulator with XRE-family HTH domain
MSCFGKNIKKIRTVKGLSQAAFADIFELKRATLGAYEEGRSEPKIDTIIKVANYFSISIDDILKKEITVNELLQFKGDVTKIIGNDDKDLLSSIPLINVKENSNYGKKYSDISYINSLPILKVPLHNSKNYRAFEVVNLEMSANEKGFFPKDIIIGEEFDLKNIQELSNGSLVIVVLNDNVIFRKYYFLEEQIVLKAEHKSIEDYIFEKSELLEIWVVKASFYNRIPDFSNTVEDRLLSMQEEIRKMKSKFSS